MYKFRVPFQLPKLVLHKTKLNTSLAQCLPVDCGGVFHVNIRFAILRHTILSNRISKKYAEIYCNFLASKSSLFAATKLAKKFPPLKPPDPIFGLLAS